MTTARAGVRAPLLSFVLLGCAQTVEPAPPPQPAPAKTAVAPKPPAPPLPASALARFPKVRRVVVDGELETPITLDVTPTGAPSTTLGDWETHGPDLVIDIRKLHPDLRLAVKTPGAANGFSVSIADTDRDALPRGEDVIDHKEVVPLVAHRPLLVALGVVRSDESGRYSHGPFQVVLFREGKRDPLAGARPVSAGMAPSDQLLENAYPLWIHQRDAEDYAVVQRLLMSAPRELFVFARPQPGVYGLVAGEPLLRATGDKVIAMDHDTFDARASDLEPAPMKRRVWIGKVRDHALATTSPPLPAELATRWDAVRDRENDCSERVRHELWASKGPEATEAVAEKRCAKERRELRVTQKEVDRALATAAQKDLAAVKARLEALLR